MARDPPLAARYITITGYYCWALSALGYLIGLGHGTRADRTGLGVCGNDEQGTRNGNGWVLLSDAPELVTRRPFDGSSKQGSTISFKKAIIHTVARCLPYGSVDLSCPITHPKNSTLWVAPGPLPPCRTQKAGDDWLGGMPRLLLLAGFSYRDWGIGWGKEAAVFSALTPTLESRGPFPMY